MSEPDGFASLVQDALEHLYDPAYLLVHPLAANLTTRGDSEAPGQALHRLLRDAIAGLKPASDAPLHSPPWRSYHYLSLRYVEMLTIGQVARELGVSPRQCRRDHHDAMSALCSMLRSKFRFGDDLKSANERPGPGSDVARERTSGELLESEIGKMGSTTVTTTTNLNQVIESVVATLSILAKNKNVLFSLDLPAAVPPVVADRTVLRQLLLELLLNAIDRGADGQVRLTVNATLEAVRVIITARSPGAATTGRGNGLGADDSRIEVSRRLADLQGFTLLVESGGDGLEASLSLPSDQAPLVLVVDDNADVIHMFRHYLDGIYEVLEATSGEQAISLARQVRPRVITLDVMMPSQDGWEILQTLKHDPVTGNIPVIVCSVLRERELALSLGAADYLAKPVTGRQLVSALHRCRLAS